MCNPLSVAQIHAQLLRHSLTATRETLLHATKMQPTSKKKK